MRCCPLPRGQDWKVNPQPTAETCSASQGNALGLVRCDPSMAPPSGKQSFCLGCSLRVGREVLAPDLYGLPLWSDGAGQRAGLLWAGRRGASPRGDRTARLCPGLTSFSQAALGCNAIYSRCTERKIEAGRARAVENPRRVYLVIVRSPLVIEVQLVSQVGDAVRGPDPRQHFGQTPALLLSHLPAGTWPLCPETHLNRYPLLSHPPCPAEALQATATIPFHRRGHGAETLDTWGSGLQKACFRGAVSGFPGRRVSTALGRVGGGVRTHQHSDRRAGGRRNSERGL